MDVARAAAELEPRHLAVVRVLRPEVGLDSAVDVAADIRVTLGHGVHEEPDELHVRLALGAVGGAQRFVAAAVGGHAGKLCRIERECGDEGHGQQAGHGSRLRLLVKLHVASVVVAHLAHAAQLVGIESVAARPGVRDEVGAHVQHALVAAGGGEELERACDGRLHLEVLLRHAGRANRHAIDGH